MSKFKFPMEVDMAPFCETGSVKGDAMYELFSVVVHSGSTHSGHYVAYIRDVDHLGHWTYPVSAWACTFSGHARVVKGLGLFTVHVVA